VSLVRDQYGRPIAPGPIAVGTADIGGELWLFQRGFGGDGPGLTAVNESTVIVPGISRADVVAGKVVVTWMIYGAPAARIVQMANPGDISGSFSMLYFDPAGAAVAPSGLAHIAVWAIAATS
jgi:hypothetical protein